MHNILIVDDMLFNRKMMMEILEDKTENNRFFQAEDGVEALEKIREEEIDLVILDLMMPNKDGYDVLKEIKEDDALKDIPVIVNSSIKDMDSIKTTLEMGAMDYFTKPLSPDQMEVIIPLKVENALKYYTQNKKLKQMNATIGKEMKIAGMLQKSIMSKSLEVKDSRFDMHLKYMPCKDLSGDIFQLAKVQDEEWFMMADMKGHGAAAALLSFKIKDMFNSTILKYSGPGKVLEEINRQFSDLMSEAEIVFFTAFVGVIKEDKLIYSSAGHPSPVLISHDNSKSTILEKSGHFIGIMDDAKYEDNEIILSQGDVLILYTDGLFNENIEDIKPSKVLTKGIKVYSDDMSSKELTEEIYKAFVVNEELIDDDLSIAVLKLK